MHGLSPANLFESSLFANSSTHFFGTLCAVFGTHADTLYRHAFDSQRAKQIVIRHKSFYPVEAVVRRSAPSRQPSLQHLRANPAMLYSVQSTGFTPDTASNAHTFRGLYPMVNRTRRAFFTATVFLAICAVAGTVYSGKVSAQSATQESSLRDSLHSFTDVYGIVEQNYAEHLDSDKVDKAIYDGAIPGMLHVLDPHSNFYDPKAFAQMREDQHGKYYGVGMSIQPQGTKIVVLAPFEGTPSYRAGTQTRRRDPVRSTARPPKECRLSGSRFHAERTARNPRIG